LKFNIIFIIFKIIIKLNLYNFLKLHNKMASPTKKKKIEDPLEYLQDKVYEDLNLALIKVILKKNILEKYQ